ncbi:MAG TPA: DUF3471 domain-containing protein [Rhizomicrobium sp.]|jgi:hypothetical protein
MSVPSPGFGQVLPAKPSLEFLRNEAKRRLRALRTSAPQARLAEVQLRLAREHGFASWRALKDEIDRRAGATKYARYVGHYAFPASLVSNTVATITENNGRLSVQNTGRPKFELRDEGNGVFLLPAVSATYRFTGAESGPATGVTAGGKGREVHLRRTDRAAARAADIAHAQALKEQQCPRVAIALPPETLDRYTGYYATAGAPAFEVLRDGNRLLAKVGNQHALEIFPESETAFFWTVGPVQVSFALEDGVAAAAILHEAGCDQRLPRVSPEAARKANAPFEKMAAEQVKPRSAITVSGGVLKRYAGLYQGVLNPDQLITVTAEGDRLFAEVTGQARFEVYPETERRFFWTVVAAQITFFPDETGHTTQALLHQNGRDLPLARIDAHAA